MIPIKSKYEIDQMIAAGKINIKDMVTHTFTLDKLSEAVDLVIERPDGLIKAVVHPWD